MKKVGWIETIDEFVVSECAEEALTDGDGQFASISFMSHLDKNGMQIINKENSPYDDHIESQFCSTLFRNWQRGDDMTSTDVRDALSTCNLKIAQREIERGDGRKTHYGTGRINDPFI